MKRAGELLLRGSILLLAISFALDHKLFAALLTVAAERCLTITWKG